MIRLPALTSLPKDIVQPAHEQCMVSFGDASLFSTDEASAWIAAPPPTIHLSPIVTQKEHL
jgi:hypothetical protein